MIIRLDENEVSNLLRAIIAIHCDQLNEAALTSSDELRKSYLNSAEGWLKLHDKIRAQVDFEEEMK